MLRTLSVFLLGFFLTQACWAQIARPMVGQLKEHVVQEGEDLVSIALHYRLAVDHLAYANGFPITKTILDGLEDSPITGESLPPELAEPPCPSCGSKKVTQSAEVADDESRTTYLLGTPFKFGRHGESGLEFSELQPHVSQHADQIAVIRSMFTEHRNHEQAIWMARYQPCKTQSGPTHRMQTCVFSCSSFCACAGIGNARSRN